MAKYDPPAPEPEHIRLPDGRRVALREIRNRVSQATTINCQTGTTWRQTRQPGFPGRPGKYTIQDRIWQSENTPQAIAQRYHMTLTSARTIKNYARRIVRAAQDLKELNTQDSPGLSFKFPFPCPANPGAFF